MTKFQVTYVMADDLDSVNVNIMQSGSDSLIGVVRDAANFIKQEESVLGALKAKQLKGISILILPDEDKADGQ